MGESKKWFERNPKKTIFALIFIVVFLIISATEMILGLFVDDGWPGVSLNDNHIRIVEYAPNINTKIHPTDEYIKSFRTEGLLEKEYIFRTDSLGYIKPSFIHSKPELTIVFLGGSSTECAFVNEENRFASLRLLEEKTAKKVNSINAGVSGLHSLSNLNKLINRIIPLQPDYVVMMNNLNDLSTLIYTGSYWNTSNRALVENKEKISIGLRCRRLLKTVIPYIYTSLKSIILSNNGSDEWAKYRNNSLDIQQKKILVSFSRSIESFIQICKIWGIEPVLMTQANRFNENSYEKKDIATENLLKQGFDYIKYKNIYDLMNSEVRKIAVYNNITLIDLEKLIPSESNYLYDNFHLSDTGSILAAEIISQHFVNLIIN